MRNVLYEVYVVHVYGLVRQPRVHREHTAFSHLIQQKVSYLFCFLSGFFFFVHVQNSFTAVLCMFLNGSLIP